MGGEWVIFTYSFIQQALFAGLIVGLISPLVGLFLVVRRLPLIADALSHVNLSGMAAGLLLQKHFAWAATVSPLYVGMLFSVIGAFFVEKLRRAYHSFQELAIPIMLSAGIAIGVILISASGGFSVDIAGYLFGNLLAVSQQDLVAILLAGMITVLFVVLFYKELFALSFDEEYAILTGVRRRLVNTLFILIVALVISVAIRAVGILLVSALITLPVATSLQFVSSFRQAIGWSIFFAEVAVCTGFIAAYYLDWASGGTIVLVSVLLFLGVYLSKRISRHMRRRKAS